MALRINSNIAAMTAQRAMASVTQKLAGNYRRLSPGLRISTAADDAAAGARPFNWAPHLKLLLKLQEQGTWLRGMRTGRRSHAPAGACWATRHRGHLAFLL